MKFYQCIHKTADGPQERRGRRRCPMPLCLLLTLLLSLLCAQGVFAAEDGTATAETAPAAAADDGGVRTVRVAFPTQSGMCGVGNGGDLIGYNYSYLEQLAEYAGWKLEYITYESQTANEGILTAMTQIQDGEADLLGPILKSAAAEELFEFPENNYGVVYTTLCSLEKSNITAVNFGHLKPVRVAVYTNASQRNKEVEEYLRSMNADYLLIECDSPEEQWEMLENGEADLLSSITLSFFEGTTAVANFAPRPYYFVSTKGNSELMAELDKATDALNYTRPHLQAQLQTQYFGDTSAGFVLTDDEKDYVSRYGTLRVLCAPDYAPLVRKTKNGQAEGLLPSILNDFASKTGLQVSYAFADDLETLETLWDTGDYDALIGLPFNSGYCTDHRVIETLPVVEVDMGYVSKPGTNKPYSTSTVAVYAALKEGVDPAGYGEVLACDSVDACFDAVENGKADYALFNRLSIDYEMAERGLSYISTPLLEKTASIAVALTTRADNRLLSALNKYICSLPSATKTAYLSAASTREPEHSLRYFVRTQPTTAVGVFTTLATLLLVVLMLAYSSRRNRVRNAELQRANEGMRAATLAMQRASAAKSDFLARMSHDIRTPMNAILGFAELGRQDAHSEELVTQDLERISSSGDFLLGLVNDVLDMSKIESNAMELHPAPCALSRFIEQLTALVQPMCLKKKIDFTVTMSDDMPPALMVDGLRLKQILFNLLSNAVKFTPEGGKVSVCGEKLGEKDGVAQLRYSVRDNGIGMSEEFQRRMFDSFTQEQQQDSGEQGSGLGLSIVKSLVELMHGTIEVHSALGQGTEFVLDLEAPVCERPAESKTGAAAAEYAGLAGKRVLLCEDHPLNTALAVRLLQNAGMSVQTAANGKEGVAAFEASDVGGFDAILMDIRMPVMDGLQATRAIRALARPDAKTIPILAMTANAYDEDVRSSMEAGMDAHIIKPIDTAALYEKLEKLVGRKDG